MLRGSTPPGNSRTLLGYIEKVKETMADYRDNLISSRQRKRVGVIQNDGKMYEICLTGSKCCGYDVAILIPENLREEERDWRMEQVQDCIYRYMESMFPPLVPLGESKNKDDTRNASR